jgi:hypothetical protein
MNVKDIVEHCPQASEHETNETCTHCGLEVDRHGNTEQDFRNCCFPDCGCDGARLCMAQTPNFAAIQLNIEKGSLKR